MAVVEVCEPCARGDRDTHAQHLARRGASPPVVTRAPSFGLYGIRAERMRVARDGSSVTEVVFHAHPIYLDHAMWFAHVLVRRDTVVTLETYDRFFTLLYEDIIPW